VSRPTIDQMGAPSYGPLGDPDGFVYHTPENGQPTLAAAIATARWQASSLNTSGGSYHGILGHDAERGPMADPDAWVMVRTVPWSQAAGGLSTRRDAVWAPDRFPWIRQLLSAAAFGDPNRFMLQLALGGNAAWWTSQLGTNRAGVRGALISMARWTLRLEQLLDFDAVLTLHRHWQTNRTDPAGLNFADLVLDEYARITAPAPAPAPVDPDAARIADLERTVSRLRARIGNKNEQLDAAAVAIARAREV